MERSGEAPQRSWEPGPGRTRKDAEFPWAVRDWRLARVEKNDKKAGVAGTVLCHTSPKGWVVSPEVTREPWEGWKQEKDGVQTQAEGQQFQIQADGRDCK